MSDNEILGITVHGLVLITEDAVDPPAPVFFPAEAVDALMSGSPPAWGRGKLHGLRTAPPPEAWPERWRVLAEPPAGT